ncbi:MAG TPA: GNAT family N-acetyltransferase [Marinobacter sp.]|nr:GNAT family N-acetyltransferase [Marinobacter sp.]
MPGPTPDQNASAWPRWQQQLERLGERRLVLVEGDPAQARLRAFELVSLIVRDKGLWVGDPHNAADAGLAHSRARDYRQWLGRELSVLVWDGHYGNPPDAFAALAGTLKAGGLLIWLMPPLDQWHQHPDPDYARTGLDGTQHHPFAARQARILAETSEVIRLPAAQSGWPALPALPEANAPFRIATTDEQSALIAALVKFALGRRRRPLVITADRGRGKSAALGMAAAQSLLAGRQRVIVTAPAPDSVDTLFQHARATLGTGLARQEGHELITTSGARLSYLPITELLSQRPEAEVVLVDEAAALPPQSLREVLLGWPRVAFATTVHGYEGSGRGFDLRFRAVLDRETPHWRAERLEQPIRWRQNDPLEGLLARLLLLDAQALGTEPEPPGAVTIKLWHPAQASEAELADAFGLLVNAHYRTSPSDLRQWLDDPTAVTWRAQLAGVTVGVLWASEEGGLPDPLAQAVTEGKRRIRGHLLAQSLASHGGFPDAARLSLLRVVRIAVAEPVRHRGIGRKLVAAAQSYGAGTGIDALGTSFGGETGLLRFWQRSGLAVVRLGLNRETSTGEYPVQMLCGLSAAGKQLAQGLRRRLSRHWPVLAPRQWAALPAPLLLALRADLPALTELDADDRRDLTSFAGGHRGFDLTLPVLQALESCSGMAQQLAEHRDAALWAGAVSQGWSWLSLQQSGLCAGRAEGENRLRALVGDLLANHPEL